MQYIRNILSSVICHAVKIILGFTLSIVVARSLGPYGQGYVSYFMLFFILLSTYGHLGINNASIYFQKRSEYSEEVVYSTNITILTLIWSLVALMLVLLRAVGLVLVNYSWWMIGVGCMYVLGVFYAYQLKGLYTGNERIAESNRYYLACFLLNVFLVLILWTLDLLTPFTYVCGQLLLWGLNAYLLNRRLGLAYRVSINRLLLKKELKYGGVIYFASLLIFMTYRADQFMIKHMLGEAQLGIYAMAVRIAELVLLLPDSIRLALSGRLFNDDSGIKNALRVTELTMKASTYACLLVVMVGMVMAPLVTVLYGEEFGPATAPMRLLLLGIVFVAIGKVSTPYFFSTGRPVVHLTSTSVAFVANIFLNYWLIPSCGIVGAAVASTISYALFAFGYMAWFFFGERVSLRKMFVPTKDDIKLLTTSMYKYSTKLKNAAGESHRS